MRKVYKALTIAGSDSGGGAGIQADLKTFQELNVFGMSVITVLTAQNTLGVQGVYPVPVETIEAQMDSVLSDIGADAVKTGMLYSAEIISRVASKLKEYKLTNIVVDPVMFAKGGTPLLQKEAMEVLKSELLPLATMVTPNIPEACELTGMKQIRNLEEMVIAARKLHDLGAKHILVKGGHLDSGEAIDVLFDGTDWLPLRSYRIETKHTHGTGCTLASAITAELAKDRTITEATITAKEFITAAISESLDIGGGIGPTNHAAYRKLSGGNLYE